MDPMETRVVIVGGGAAGIFAAIACAEAARNLEVIVLEQNARFLDKVSVSGGGRCNLTHSCFSPKQMAENYPRGQDALIGLFHRFSPRHTIEWFSDRGVRLKTEPDGRVFPLSNTASTITGCLLAAAQNARVQMRACAEVKKAMRHSGGGFELILVDGTRVRAARMLLATGGCCAGAGSHLAMSLGHTLLPPAPSLFGFRFETPRLRELAGISVPMVEASISDVRLSQRGPLLLTHCGVSGPVILRLSSWGARALQERNYSFVLRINWMPEMDKTQLARPFEARRRECGAGQIFGDPLSPLPGRLWRQLLIESGVPSALRWADLNRDLRHTLIHQLSCTEWRIEGRSVNRDEFVTCGGVPLNEVNLKTMESRVCPGLYFAGELLDIDGLTGGFNLQAAWTTGWIAGQSMQGQSK